ncbi:MAG TPA: hypothetical protein VMT46_04115 [Anaerolineaceae bacterium]|nr:hypothetical protein [Anaerolineaceae bacterium]
MEKSIDSNNHAERELSLEREIQALHIALDEKVKTIQHLSLELERARFDSAGNAQEIADHRIETVLVEAGRPAVMIMTQAHLLEQGRQVQARDVLNAARSLVRSLEGLGLIFVGQAGEVAAFDPNLHLVSAAGIDIPLGAPVRILVSGVQYGGKILSKSIVEKVE